VTSRIGTFINDVCNKEELNTNGKNPLRCLPVYKNGDTTVLIVEEYCSYQLRTKFYPTQFLEVNSVCRRKLLRVTSVDFDRTDQLLVRYTAVVKW
jgi:hypothetical protein